MHLYSHVFLQKKSSPAPRSDQAPKDAIKLADKLGPCVIHPAEVQPGPLAEAPAPKEWRQVNGACRNQLIMYINIHHTVIHI